MVSQWPIASGEFFDYEITPQIGDAGTYFYHSHYGFQTVSATGPLIVQDIGTPPYRYDDDVTVMLQDYYPANDSVIISDLLAKPFTWPGESYAILFNGQSGNSSLSQAIDASCAPHIIDVNPGETVRIRFIGATAISLVTLGIEDHSNLTIIEADGETTLPWVTDHVQAASGQRFSVLLKTKTQEELRSLNKTSFLVRFENRDRPLPISGYAIIQYRTSEGGQPNSIFPAQSPVTLPQEVYSWAEYSLQALRPLEPFPRLSEVTRTVYITTKQVVNNGYILSNGTVDGNLNWA